MEMEYRRLGGTGLKVSVLSFGSWVTFGPQLAGNLAEDCLAAAYDAGVNFFDNAEAYAGGESETIMGAAIKELGWPRHSYVLSTKLFWGLHSSVNMRNTLNRKYLMQAIDGSLERLGLDFVDLVYCHRPDPETPVAETVWAMSDMITAGKALYWGTSEWPAEALREAWDFADRNHLHKPVVEQPQYNLLWRDRVEQEYAPLYDGIGLGLTTWSPLASGLLTGKYRRGEDPPEGTRLAAWGPRGAAALSDGNFDKLEKLSDWADARGKSLLELALAWLLGHPVVSSVIAGATKPEQVNANAATAAWKLTPAEVEEVGKLAA